MQKTKFINRKKEIELLDNSWGKQAQLIVVWGRRRVGKTTLILKFTENKKSIYFLGRLEAKKEQLERFSYILSDFFGEASLRLSPMRSWDAVFEYILNKNEKFALIFDEFPYMIKTSPELLSILQDYWDRKIKDSNISIIICGSVLSMMERFVFDYKMPLYGRRTLDLKVNPLSFEDCREFFPDKKLSEIVAIYGIFGGTPSYLFEYEKNIDYSIEKIISKQNFLLREPIFLLSEELNEPRLFMSILHAISIGKTTMGEIISQTGLEKGIVGKYVSILLDLNIIRREITLTASWKSRKSLYFIEDNFFNFWFRFVFPNMEYIETGSIKLTSIIKKEFNSYLGFVFEDICKQFLVKKRPFEFTKIGRQWGKVPKLKETYEIDLVALNDDRENPVNLYKRQQDFAGMQENQRFSAHLFDTDDSLGFSASPTGVVDHAENKLPCENLQFIYDKKEIGFFEVKWQDLSKNNALNILEKLKQKSKYVDWHNDSRSEHFGLIAKKIENKQELKKKGFFAFDLDDF